MRAVGVELYGGNVALDLAPLDQRAHHYIRLKGSSQHTRMISVWKVKRLILMLAGDWDCRRRIGMGDEERKD